MFMSNIYFMVSLQWNLLLLIQNCKMFVIFVWWKYLENTYQFYLFWFHASFFKTNTIFCHTFSIFHVFYFLFDFDCCTWNNILSSTLLLNKESRGLTLGKPSMQMLIKFWGLPRNAFYKIGCQTAPGVLYTCM